MKDWLYYSGLDPTIFEIAYKRVFGKIGTAMQNGRNVDIDFRVGNMILKTKKTEFNFFAPY